MNIIMLLVLALARPEAAPVGAAELALFRDCLAQVPRAGVAYLPGEALPGQFVIGFEPGASAAAGGWVTALGGSVRRVDEAAGFLVADCGCPQLLAALPPGVRYAVPDQRVYAARIPNDPFFLQQQWDKWVMYSDKAWDLATGSSSVKVGIVDNGTDYQHPDLAARFVPGQYGYDFVAMDNDPRPDNPLIPSAFHGTHVAGIVAATMDNSVGVAGWAQVQLVAVRALNDSGSGDLSDLASAIRWAVDNGCRVINMSLGADGTIPALNEACAYAFDHGVLLVAASGNQGQGTIQYPAALGECLAVGATDENSGLASFSNYGPEQGVVAPGVDVLSTSPNNGYVTASGTSMAAPEVTGVAALLLSVDNALTGSAVRALLAASALDKGAAGRDDIYGSGLVNAWRAVQLAQLLPRGAGAPAQARSGRALAVAGAVTLPGWVTAVTVYDCQGRLVTRAPARGLVLGSGTYFAACAGSGREQLLVIRSVR